MGAIPLDEAEGAERPTAEAVGSKGSDGLIFSDGFESGDLTLWSDAEPPVSIGIRSPASPTLYNDVPPIEVVFASPLVGLDLPTLRVLLDGMDLVPTCTVALTSASCPSAGIPEGSHVLLAEIRNLDGELASASFSFDLIADLVPPDLAITTPAQATIFNDSTPEIVVEYADAVSGIDLETLAVSLDGTDLTGSCQVTPSAATCEAPELTPGPHSISTQVRDAAGNLSTVTFDFDLVEDSTPPELTISSPAEAVIFNDTTPLLEVQYSDAPAGLDLGTLALALDGAALVGCTIGGASAQCESPELAEGTHTFSANVSDAAGNSAAATLDFELILDSDPPTIAITSPAEGSVFQDPEVQVSGTVSDENGVGSLSVNAQPVAVDNGIFAASVTLAPGPNTLVAEATDLAGNAASASVSVTFQSDTVPPDLTFLFPAAGTFLTDNQPDLELAFSDPGSGVDLASLELTAGGSPLAVSCDLGSTGGTCTPLAPFADGAVDLGVTLSDLAGNVASAGVLFTVDTAGVGVAITEPQDRLVTLAAEITVMGTVDAGVSSVQVNSVPAQISGSTFTAQVPLREGTNMVVALATKANGNTATASIDVTRDIVAPIVRIDAPSEGFVAIESRVTVTGQVNDVVSGGFDPQVRINGVEAAVGGGAYMLVDLELQQGQNTIEAVATDSVGNESAHAITITYQPPVGLRIRSVSGNGQAQTVHGELAQPLVVVVEDDFGIPVPGRVVRFEVVRNSGTLRTSTSGEPRRAVQVPTNSSGQAAVFLRVGDTAGEGNNRVRATGLGVAGQVEFCATALGAEPERIIMIGGDNQRGQVGNPLAWPLEALVVDGDGNPVAAVEVTFEVVEGSGSLDGQVSLPRLTDTNGIARAVLTLGPDPGINNNVVSASFEGLEGLAATATASGLPAGDPIQTRLSGVVLDNGQTAIPGARVSISDTNLETFTDAEGQFLLANVPVGHIELVIDPTDSPRPEEFPPLHFETVTVAGQSNTIGQPILLPRIDIEGSKIVGGNQDVTLDMDGVEGVSLTVFANSVTFPDGSPTGSLAISQVHLDKVPMLPPAGSMILAWTIQPSGINFNPPARITIPNNGLPPGRVIDISQFDHDINDFIIVGKGTITEDGSRMISDPGFGITRSGWGGCVPPPPPTTTANNKANPFTDPVVRQAFDDAWNDSNPGPQGAHEEGGWIIRDGDGDHRIQRWPTGQGSSIAPDDPMLSLGEEVVGSFHTHPNIGPGWIETPSEGDISSTASTIEDYGLTDAYRGCYVISDTSFYFVNSDGTWWRLGDR